VPFTLVHAGKYRTEKNLKNTKNTQTKHNPEKNKQHKTQLPWFSHILRHLARKQGTLILQYSQAHTGCPYYVGLNK